jgi:TorA maturation chaperone TorD/Pyruvate/2-oxoacid:ferredoxin oxidoreductase delta subunit
MDANVARQRSQTYSHLARAFSEAEPGLEREFTRLFLGPGRPVAHPFESVYREGRMMGQTTLDVRRRLATEGLAPAGRALPDHVGIELTFMAHLAGREAKAWDDDPEQARHYLALQGRFLHDHLAAWLPQFCHRVLAGRPHDHYAQLARQAEAFVAQDVARVQDWLGRSDGPEATAVATQPARWAVTVGQGCTLCGICVQVCRPQALQQLDRQEALTLSFNADLCDGCAACQRWCPEGLIEVAQVPPGEWVPGGELVRSDRLACPRCGRPHAPAAMVSRVQAQVGQGQTAMLQRLTLCPDCKKNDNPLSSSGGR